MWDAVAVGICTRMDAGWGQEQIAPARAFALVGANPHALRAMCRVAQQREKSGKPVTSHGGSAARRMLERCLFGDAVVVGLGRAAVELLHPSINDTVEKEIDVAVKAGTGTVLRRDAVDHSLRAFFSTLAILLRDGDGDDEDEEDGVGVTTVEEICFMALQRLDLDVGNDMTSTTTACATTATRTTTTTTSPAFAFVACMIWFALVQHIPQEDAWASWVPPRLVRCLPESTSHATTEIVIERSRKSRVDPDPTAARLLRVLQRGGGYVPSSRTGRAQFHVTRAWASVLTAALGGSSFTPTRTMTTSTTSTKIQSRLSLSPLLATARALVTLEPRTFLAGSPHLPTWVETVAAKGDIDTGGATAWLVTMIRVAQDVRDLPALMRAVLTVAVRVEFGVGVAPRGHEDGPGTGNKEKKKKSPKEAAIAGGSPGFILGHPEVCLALQGAVRAAPTGQIPDLLALLRHFGSRVGAPCGHGVEVVLAWTRAVLDTLRPDVTTAVPIADELTLLLTRNDTDAPMGTERKENIDQDREWGWNSSGASLDVYLRAWYAHAQCAKISPLVTALPGADRLRQPSGCASDVAYDSGILRLLGRADTHWLAWMEQISDPPRKAVAFRMGAAAVELLVARATYTRHRIAFDNDDDVNMVDHVSGGELPQLEETIRHLRTRIFRAATSVMQNMSAATTTTTTTTLSKGGVRRKKKDLDLDVNGVEDIAGEVVRHTVAEVVMPIVTVTLQEHDLDIDTCAKGYYQDIIKNAEALLGAVIDVGGDDWLTAATPVVMTSARTRAHFLPRLLARLDLTRERDYPQCLGLLRQYATSPRPQVTSSPTTKTKSHHDQDQDDDTCVWTETVARLLAASADTYPFLLELLGRAYHAAAHGHGGSRHTPPDARALHHLLRSCPDLPSLSAPLIDLVAGCYPPSPTATSMANTYTSTEEVLVSALEKKEPGRDPLLHWRLAAGTLQGMKGLLNADPADDGADESSRMRKGIRSAISSAIASLRKCGFGVGVEVGVSSKTIDSGSTPTKTSLSPAAMSLLEIAVVRGDAEAIEIAHHLMDAMWWSPPTTTIPSNKDDQDSTGLKTNIRPQRHRNPRYLSDIDIGWITGIARICAAWAWRELDRSEAVGVEAGPSRVDVNARHLSPTFEEISTWLPRWLMLLGSYVSTVGPRLGVGGRRAHVASSDTCGPARVVAYVVGGGDDPTLLGILAVLQHLLGHARRLQEWPGVRRFLAAALRDHEADDTLDRLPMAAAACLLLFMSSPTTTTHDNPRVGMIHGGLHAQHLEDTDAEGHHEIQSAMQQCLVDIHARRVRVVVGTRTRRRPGTGAHCRSIAPAPPPPPPPPPALISLLLRALETMTARRYISIPTAAIPSLVAAASPIEFPSCRGHNADGACAMVTMASGLLVSLLRHRGANQGPVTRVMPLVVDAIAVLLHHTVHAAIQYEQHATTTATTPPPPPFPTTTTTTTTANTTSSTFTPPTMPLRHYYPERAPRSVLVSAAEGVAGLCEEMAQIQPVATKYVAHVLATYLALVCAPGGIPAVVAGVLRGGGLALYDACKSRELQHMFASLAGDGTGAQRGALADLRREHETHFKHGGKV